VSVGCTKQILLFQRTSSINIQLKCVSYKALKSDLTHHFFRNTCTKSGSLRFSQFFGCWLILSVYIIMSFNFRSSVILLLPLFIIISTLLNQSINQSLNQANNQSINQSTKYIYTVKHHKCSNSNSLLTLNITVHQYTLWHVMSIIIFHRYITLCS
jgi:hypothetical protein